MPHEVLLDNWCQAYHALPDAGGLLDQDWQTVYGMRVLANIYYAVSHFANAVGDQIHSLTVDERRLIRWLRDNGYWD